MGNSNVFKRNAGILMAISSLPSPYGIGTLGKDAYEFVDFVRDSNHKYWQVLPVGPTTYGDSPYQPYSAFAGNPYFVDLDMLIEEGLLLKSEVIAVDWGDGIIPVEVSEDDAVNNRYPVNHDGYLGDDRYVSYEKMYNERFNVLRKAYERFKGKCVSAKLTLDKGLPLYKRFDNFVKDNAYWLKDYAMFMSLKEYFNQKAWGEWDRDIKFREPEAMQRYEDELSDDIGLRFSNSEWPEYPLFADKYINWIDALPQEEQVINIFMELSALGMAQPLSSNILEFLKALPECAKSKGITFSTPTEIVSKLKSVSQLDVPYPMSWVDEERDTSSWLGNILQREAFNKLYSVAERVHLCDDRRIKQDWDYLQASNNFRFMTTKNTGIWLNRGIYDSPYDAFTNYMNILGDFIKRVDSLYPVDVDNEELNSLLTTIKNQGEEIAELQKEVTKWQAKAEKGAVKAPKKVAAKKEPVAKATRKKATAKKEE